MRTYDEQKRLTEPERPDINEVRRMEKSQQAWVLGEYRAKVKQWEKEMLKWENENYGDIIELQLVGYWNDKEDHAGYQGYQDQYILPQHLPVIKYKDADKIIEYLNGGLSVVYYMGMSYCRICGTYSNGCCERSDGKFYWPEGLSHYVKDHDISLPYYFLDHIRESDYKYDLKNLEARYEREWRTVRRTNIEFKENMWIDYCEQMKTALKTKTRISK